jgi:hypothetical protein
MSSTRLYRPNTTLKHSSFPIRIAWTHFKIFIKRLTTVKNGNTDICLERVKLACDWNIVH